jgi:starvation-inducible DNA-binding protein
MAGSRTSNRVATLERRQFATSIDLPAEARTKLIQMLNQQLADTFDLFSQTKQAHWNVKGPQFYQLHVLYDEMAEHLLEHIDNIAERITALGGTAMGTARMAATSSRLQDFPQDAIDSLDNVRALAQCYAMLTESTREGIDISEQLKDMTTNDLLIDVTRDLDKFLWFLEAHLQGGNGAGGNGAGGRGR